MRQHYSWEDMIPVDETHAAAKSLATTWNLIAKSFPKQIRYSKHEPKLTELLHYYLCRLKAKSGLTGFWVNEGQELYMENDGNFLRSKKDITYCSNRSKLPIEITFEFKKLSSSSIATYRGEKGMRRFVDGTYAIQKPLAVMVGILVQGQYDNIIKALFKALSRNNVQCELKMVPDAIGRFIRQPSEAIQPVAEFDTEHRRPVEKTPPNGTITIAHIFLMCNQ